MQDKPHWLTAEWIAAQRPGKNVVDPWKPYAFLAEPERGTDGRIDEVATIFLTNRECPFRCLMCDLWKNTTDKTVPPGAIPAQIQYALDRLPPARHIKLYNSGNFFDSKAIPVSDWPAIAKLVAPFRSVVVECHPNLVDERCLEFRDMIQPQLQVAMGLETVHEVVLARMNKSMILADFDRSVRFLSENKIPVRAFILLRPPFLSEAEGIEWAKRSLAHAFDAGVECCAVIPTRTGNGALEKLKEQGLFESPRIGSLEEVVAYGIGLGQGRVFADLWDIERFYSCPECGPDRRERLIRMNHEQIIPAEINCHCQ